MTQASPPPPGSRLAWIDTAKGIAIILVVIGHTLRGLISARIIADTPGQRLTDSWIYAFHMPLFFFVSGFFLPRSARKEYSVFVEDKLRTIAYPYFVWSAVTLIFKSSLGRFTNHPTRLADGWRILFEPIEQFWFLYALFLILVVLGGLLKLGLKPWMLGILALAVHPSLLPIPGGPWGPAIQARRNAVYAALGAWFGSSSLSSRIAEVRSNRLIIVAIAAFGLLTAMVVQNLQNTPGFSIVAALLGIVGCLAVAIALNGKGILGEALNLCGLYSLEIFTTHTMASAGLRIALQKLLRIQDPTLHFLLGTLAGIVFPIAFGIACKRFGFDFVFTLRKKRPAR
jgi:fucose 4-O-acetylase-like acetyltransferase